MQFKNLQKIFLALSLSGIGYLVQGQTTCVTCPGTIVVDANANCRAIVTYAMPANCPNVRASHASGSFFPLGTTTVTLTNGPTSCSFDVIVRDVTAPVISNPTASPNSLWPPNHKFRDVRVNYTTMDNCPGMVSCQLTVTSNEPVNSIGDGNTAPDWIIVNANNVKLRAERAGPLTGRIYTISVSCRDVAGNTSVKTTTVTVPHDMGKNKSERDPSVPGLAETKEFDVNVLSNPTRNYFTFKLQSSFTDAVNVRVVDMAGKLIESKSNLNPNQTLTLGDNYRPGVYFVEIRQGEQSKKVRVVKSE